MNLCVTLEQRWSACRGPAPSHPDFTDTGRSPSSVFRFCKPPRWRDDPVSEPCEMSNDDSWRHAFAYPLSVEPQQCIEPRGMFTVYAGLVWASSAECFTPDIPF